MAIRNLHIGKDILVDILVDLVFHNLLADGTQRIGGKDAQAVLMAVQREHQHFRRVVRRHDAGNIAVGIKGQLDGARLVALDVETQHAELRVLFACLRIFVGVEAGIGSKLLALRLHTAKHRHAVFLDLALVIAHPDNLFRVGREDHSTVVRELLFAHPVGQSVDDLVAFAILRHLTLGIIVEQFHEEDVIVTHKGYLGAIGREEGCLLRATIGKRFQLVEKSGVCCGPPSLSGSSRLFTIVYI